MNNKSIFGNNLLKEHNRQGGIQTDNSTNEPIAFFEFGRHYFGGSYQSSVKLIEGLKEKTRVVVIDANGIQSQYLTCLREMDIEIKVVAQQTDPITIGGNGRLGRTLKFARTVPEIISFIAKLRQIIKEVNPRALWTNSEKGLFMLTVASGGKIPIAVFVRGELKKLRPYCWWAWKRVEMAFGNSKKGLKVLENSRFAPKRFKVVYTGMNSKPLLLASKKEVGPLPRLDCPMKLLFPASLIPLKNQEIAIRGLAKFIQKGNDAVIWICGGSVDHTPPDYVSNLKKLVTDLNLENNIFFLGWRDDIPAIIANCDVITLTSNTEGMPRALMEGMALARPVLATKVGGVGELVRHGIDGYLLSARDFDDYARGLEELSDPEKRKKMGQAGYQRILEDFTVEQFIDRFLDGMNEISRVTTNI